jgi:hypothetical protein
MAETLLKYKENLTPTCIWQRIPHITYEAKLIITGTD